MASDANRLNANALNGAEVQVQSLGETNQPNWDVPTLLQSERQGTKKLLSEQNIIQFEKAAPQNENLTFRWPATGAPRTELALFAEPKTNSPTQTFSSPYKSPLAFPQAEPEAPLATRLEPLPRERTTMEILNKPITELNANDFGIISKRALDASKDYLSTVDSDYAGIAGFVVRYKSEKLIDKFPTNSTMIRGAAAVPLAGVSGYMLKSDVESFGKTTSIAQKAYYATASAADATALVGSIGTLFPQTRAAAGTTAALSFLARAGMGWTHHTFFPDKESR